MVLLLIAQSARMLAQSAARAGLAACAIDHYADADTRRLAARCFSVAPEAGAAGWLASANQAAPPGRPCALVYGSGVDTRPGLLAQLAQGRALLGNPPAILRRVHSPQTFFRLLQSLGIPYPETRFAPPECAAGWLVKPGCGEGGKGVGFAANNPGVPGDTYYQRHIAGAALSVLFLADGRRARVVGFNTQWTAGHDPGQPFLFAGAVNRADLDADQRVAVAGYAEKLAAALGLVGLNSLDFMRDGGVCRVLELNPRPSTTLALYDDDFDQGLLAWHIAACQGRLPPGDGADGPARALRVVYAPQALLVRENARWPQAAADIPNPGTRIAAGHPLCSLLAQGADRLAAEAALRKAEAELWRGLAPTPGDGRTE